MLATALLLIPLRWIIACVLAVIFHELAHYLCIFLCGGEVLSLQVGGKGISMEMTPINPLRELLSTMAGPISSLLLLFIRRWFPELALCGLVHGLFNLLPIFPLDGGRILMCIMQLMKIESSHFVWIQRGILLALITATLWLQYRLHAGLILLIPLCVIIIKNIKIKNLAKSRGNSYNSYTNQ